MTERVIYVLFLFLFSLSCGGGSGSSESSNFAVTLHFERIDIAGPDPFKVTAAVTDNGSPVSGAELTLTIPRGSVSSVADKGNGKYEFTVTPSGTGVYPVTVSCNGAVIRRDALVVNQLEAGSGQPLLVPGLVNTDGYEDGITITPDGEYLFIQYGPIYFSGVFLHQAICTEAGWSLYDLVSCPGKDDSSWVFDTVGPYNDVCRPGFPSGAINSGKLSHLNIVIPGVANKIALFPTIFYGFKRQSDGTFGQPFKLAFNDSKGANGPFGLSFQMTGPSTAKFVVAWDNYFNHLGDDKPDIYQGTVTMNQDNNLGDVVYSGEGFSSITPNISPVSFASHNGVQGNPHLYYDGAGTIKSIWTDDEQVSHDLSVYVLTGGTFPAGTWSMVALPSKINTAQSESQPFFTGARLYLNREVSIVYHEFTGTHDAAGYGNNANWGDEVIVLKSGDIAIGGIYGVGEPTIASRDGKNYLYFAFVETRAAGVGAGRNDYNLGAGFIELP
jgi:hypothetical protein